ncbi:MAG: DUF2877 domain-containing protein [Alkalispirochaeta sp.]
MPERDSIRSPLSRPVRGVLTPEDGAYPVAGTHDGIVNLSAQDEAGHYLISVISDPIHWTELAVLVRPEHSWWGQHRSAGDRVAIGELGAISAPPPGNVAAGGRIPEAVVEEAQEALLRNHRDTGFVALLSPKSPRNDPFVRRAAGLLQTAPDGTVSSILPLIGLGIGFTPAGDDFVSGVLLAQTLLSGTPPSETDRTAVRGRLHATTAGGSSLLRVAVAGFPPGYQVRMVESLREGNIEQTMEIALRHGHSSGLDALAGLLWRLKNSAYIRFRYAGI